jgi:hypothetical protein
MDSMETSVSASSIAVMATLGWPLVAIALYKMLPRAEATAWTVLGALLLLPSQFAIKIPMVPAIDKASIAGVSAILGCTLLSSHTKRPAKRFGIIEVLIAAYVVGPVVTSLLNGDSLVIGERVLPGVGLYDGISALLSQGIFLLPFIVGRRFLRTPKDIQRVLRVLVVGGLLYSIPMAFEVRFSPQLSNWIYGYFPSSFVGESRYGGFRPVVFLNNGLTLAFFVATSFLAALTLWRSKIRTFAFSMGGISAYLAAVLIMCKSFGSLIYAIVFGCLIRLTKPTTQMRVAFLLAGIAVFYPVLRLTNSFPTEQLVGLAESFNQERADSLKFRFDQEQELLAKAAERPFFGWGRYGRNRMYNEATGKDDSVTDGLWILVLGQFGLVGFLAQFGLLTLPVFRASAVIKRLVSADERVLIAGLTSIVALTAIEQLPNASISPWSWLLSGALLGQADRLRSQSRSLVQTLNSKPAEAPSDTQIVTSRMKI